jgi:hypothetical protein
MLKISEKPSIVLILCAALVALAAYGRGDIVLHIFDQLLGVVCAGFAGYFYAQYHKSKQEDIEGNG